MRNYRLLVVEFVRVQQLEPLYKWQLSNLEQLNRYNVKMMFVKSKSSRIRLYGYDETEKWKTGQFKDIRDIFRTIDTMPMSRYDKSKRVNVFYEMCGIPESESTRHCFYDDTHLTCCMLGGNARRYADLSGNPIGTAAAKAFTEYYGFSPSDNTLTPWCTCVGSQVCSFYGKRFSDGTHIKYIMNKNGEMIISTDESKYIRYKHSTPGIS